MNFTANWEMSGVSFDSSSNAFIKSAQYAVSSKTLKKHESLLNKTFKENISINMRRSGMDADNLSDVFALQINDGGINFINTEPLITQRYEYGYYNGSKDTNEEYYEEYMIQTSPRYFIRPAIEETMNTVGNILLEEAKKEYTILREHRDETL